MALSPFPWLSILHPFIRTKGDLFEFFPLIFLGLEENAKSKGSQSKSGRKKVLFLASFIEEFFTPKADVVEKDKKKKKIIIIKTQMGKV